MARRLPIGCGCSTAASVNHDNALALLALPHVDGLFYRPGRLGRRILSAFAEHHRGRGSEPPVPR